MNVEANRLNTFVNWPSSAPVDPVRIAKAGFFYTGNGTEVECFSCRKKISDWNYGDQVMWRHRVLEPNCSFVVTPQLSGNVPSVGQGCAPVPQESRAPENAGRPTTPVRYGLTQEDEMYRSDALRLLSYVNWDDTSVSRESLVNAGFYHAGGGRLRCAWCGGELSPFRNLGSLGSPLDIHKRYFPMCEFAIQRARMENYRLGSLRNTDTDDTETTPETNDTPNTPQTSGTEQNEQIASAGNTWRELGVVSGGARHPSKASLAARMATFDRWPYDRPQAPQSLAEAGFFFTGVEDQVRCFYCDGGLGKWERGDVPWREHARWFPQCGYVLLIKGRRFVDDARATMSSKRAVNTNPNAGLVFTVTDTQIDACMESACAAAALGAGLDAARVRRAIVKRLRTTGSPFPTSESLIDAVLDEQLNEEAWSTTSQLLARDTINFFSDANLRAFNVDGDTDSRPSSESSSPLPDTRPVQVYRESREKDTKTPEKKETPKTPEKELTLEEENRQLKEARLCKVCMDNEVSMVFLPCGHLVVCARCSAALAACPLCRAPVKALVRAYFA